MTMRPQQSEMTWSSIATMTKTAHRPLLQRRLQILEESHLWGENMASGRTIQ